MAGQDMWNKEADKAKIMGDFRFKALPENCQNAILLAIEKKKHSDFYYKLQHVTDKLDVFTDIFYDKEPSYIKWWRLKKEREQEILERE